MYFKQMSLCVFAVIKALIFVSRVRIKGKKYTFFPQFCMPSFQSPTELISGTISVISASS